MITTNKSISETINSDYKNYAMYVLENRAIPCYIDGMKTSQRKLLYAMINEHKGKRTKISDLGSISKFGYLHGETSAMSAAIGLAANWSNNVPIFQQHGSFGSRLIPEPAAARYIYAELNQDFYKYFTDFDILDKRAEIEDPEPQTYLPNIPWCLVNGIKGIAIGFACEYLPHDPKDIANACIKSIDKTLKADEVLIPSFPNFNGEIEVIEHNKFDTKGKISNIKGNTWEITELPWGVTREKFFEILTKLEDDNEILDFEDNCSKEFNFIIKVNSKQNIKIAKDPIKFFKLSKTYTENYTALDEHGKLILFDTKVEIIEKFIEYRIKKVQEQINYDLNKFQESLNFLEVKLKFISDALDDKFDFKNITKKQLTDKVILDYNIDSDTAMRLSRISMFDITKDMVKNLKDKINEVELEMSKVKNLKADEVLKERLNEICNY